MVSVQGLFRRQLALLKCDTAILDALGEPSSSDRGIHHPAQWVRTYGRLLQVTADFASPGSHESTISQSAESRRNRRPYAVVVLERMHPRQDIRTMEVYGEEPENEPGRRVTKIADLGFIAETQFPIDRRLPTLPEAIAHAGDGVVVVRYRPGRRCTFRVDRQNESFFCKVFPDDTGRRLHEEAQQLYAASARGQLGFAVAEPVAWDAGTRTLWQRSLGGRSIGSLLAGSDGTRLATHLGRAAGTIVSATITPTARFDAAVQCDRSRRYARELGARVPALAQASEALLETLVSIHAQCGSRLLPIHGAPHMNQWLKIGRELGLVDFDRLSVGDPELDVATFLGELDFEDGLTSPIEAIASAFIAGYEESAGRLEPRLLAAYRAHKRLAKALRSARALRPDGDARAARHFKSAVNALLPADRPAALHDEPWSVVPA